MRHVARSNSAVHSWNADPPKSRRFCDSQKLPCNGESHVLFCLSARRAQFFLSLEIRHGDAGDAEEVGHVAPRCALLDAIELAPCQRDDDADRL